MQFKGLQTIAGLVYETVHQLDVARNVTLLTLPVHALVRVALLSFLAVVRAVGTLAEKGGRKEASSLVLRP